jgi:hypothetical protein
MYRYICIYISLPPDDNHDSPSVIPVVLSPDKALVTTTGIYMYLYIYIYIHINVYMYIYMYIYIPTA